MSDAASAGPLFFGQEDALIGPLGLPGIPYDARLGTAVLTHTGGGPLMVSSINASVPAARDMDWGADLRTRGETIVRYRAVSPKTVTAVDNGKKGAGGR